MSSPIASKRPYMLVLLLLALPPQAYGNCSTGGEYAVTAYIYFNPIYDYYFNSFQSYIAENRARFRADSDGVACAYQLASALKSAAVQAFDPDEVRRREELNTELATHGIGPGNAQPSFSTQLAMAADRMHRLARGLPAAADGDFGPLYTPTTEEEQVIIFAEQIFRDILNTPDMRTAMEKVAPQIQELANLEYKMFLGFATAQ